MKKTKSLEVFMTSADEHRMLAGLRSAFPWIVLVETKTLRILAELGDEVQVEIPTTEIEEPLVPGRIPPLIRFLRSRVRRSTLLEGKKELGQGRLAIVYDRENTGTDEVVGRVWKIVRAMCTSDVIRINPVSGTVYGDESNIFLGPDAIHWFKGGDMLAGNAANVFYAPARLGESYDRPKAASRPASPGGARKPRPTRSEDRLSYEESCRVLRGEDIIDDGVPPFPARSPRHDDDNPGLSFFRTVLSDATLDNLTLPRTFFCRSEIRNASFRGTDISESTANWNDFVDVDFERAELARCDFRGCSMTSVRFTYAHLAGADLRHCSFADCNFVGADLTSAKLSKDAGKSLSLSPEQRRAVDWQDGDGPEPEGG